MDPDAVLDNLRKLAEQALARSGSTGIDWEDVAKEMAETFQGLDEWLTKGGFLPLSWRVINIPAQADHDPNK